MNKNNLKIEDVKKMTKTEIKALCYDELKLLELHGNNIKILENILNEKNNEGDKNNGK